MAIQAQHTSGTQDLPVQFHINVGALLNRPLPDLLTLRSWAAMLPSASDEPEVIALRLIFIVASAMSLLLCCGAVYEHLASRRRVMAVKAELTRLMTALLFRDTLLSAGWEAIVVRDAQGNDTLRFGRGGELLASCSAGPDGAATQMALDALAAHGSSFDLTAHGSGGRLVRLRGCPVGARSVIYAQTLTGRMGLVDFRELVTALPLPLSLWDERRDLLWSNPACAAHETSATHATLNFDVAAGDRIVTARVAFDVGVWAEREAALLRNMEELDRFVERLQVAVAVFGADRRHQASNAAFAERFALPQMWLDSDPSFERILDAMRMARLIPEQREFPRFEARLVALFADARGVLDEVWHLPNGRCERVRSHRNSLGGLTFLFEDLTRATEVERSYNSVLKVQHAMLEHLDDAIAVFGADGRLRLHNMAFARLWRLEDADLAASPHLRTIDQICAFRFGADECWTMIIRAVSAIAPQQGDLIATVNRADGRALTLSVTRLPDGSTMAMFCDRTDELRWAAESAAAPAGRKDAM